MARTALIATLYLIIIFQIFSEKIPVHDGAYGNGLFYREVTTSFLDQIDSDQGYTFLQVQRILPFALINASYTLFGFDFEANSLISGMLIFNLLLLTLGLYWYFKIAKKLRLNANLEALGFILLFFSFPVLKEYWYDPFTTDLTAFVLGIGQVNYFIRYEKSKLLLISIIGAFVWPALFFVGLILSVLPNKPLEIYQGDRVKSFFPVFAAAVLIGMAALTSFAFDRLGDDFSRSEMIWHKISLLSLTPFILYVMINNPINWEKTIPLIYKNFQVKNILMVIGASVGVTMIIFLISTNNAQVNLYNWFQNFWNKILRFPLDFLPAHTIYYGLLFPILIAFISRVNKSIAKFGIGFFVVCVLLAALSIHPESRLIIAFVPFFVLLILKALRRFSLSSRDVYLALTINLLISAFWLPVNSDKLFDTFLNNKAWSTLADLRYFIHFGQYFNFWTYLGGCLLCFMLTFLSFKAKHKYVREKQT